MDKSLAELKNDMDGSERYYRRLADEAERTCDLASRDFARLDEIEARTAAIRGGVVSGDITDGNISNEYLRLIREHHQLSVNNGPLLDRIVRAYARRDEARDVWQAKKATYESNAG